MRLGDSKGAGIRTRSGQGQVGLNCTQVCFLLCLISVFHNKAWNVGPWI